MSHRKYKLIMVKYHAQWYKCQDLDWNPHSADQKQLSQVLPLGHETPNAYLLLYSSKNVFHLK